jgi:hypothetical protein
MWWRKVRDLREIQIGGDDRLLIRPSLGEDLSIRTPLQSNLIDMLGSIARRAQSKRERLRGVLVHQKHPAATAA